MTRTIVIAPDSFKGTIAAADAAQAIAAGWLEERPDDDIRLLPMADGGEGTLEAFATAVPGAERVPVRVIGPGRPRGRHVLAAAARRRTTPPAERRSSSSASRAASSC